MLYLYRYAYNIRWPTDCFLFLFGGGDYIDCLCIADFCKESEAGPPVFSVFLSDSKASYRVILPVFDFLHCKTKLVWIWMPKTAQQGLRSEDCLAQII